MFFLIFTGQQSWVAQRPDSRAGYPYLHLYHLVHYLGVHFSDIFLKLSEFRLIILTHNIVKKVKMKLCMNHAYRMAVSFII